MLKIAVILVLSCCVYGVQSNCGPPCKHSCRTICAADSQIKNCERLTECQLRRENCIRRQSHRPLLSTVASVRCRKLSRPRGKGLCEPVARPKRNSPPTCNHIPCTSKQSKTLVCARCRKDDTCRSITKCQFDRINCKRGPQHPMQQVDLRRCRGMKLNDSLQKCRK